MSRHVEQVGGDHYNADLAEAEDQQHWDYMERYDIDYLVGNASKYIMRWRKKGVPLEDLGKAKSYLEKALACRVGRGALRLIPRPDFDEMCKANAVHEDDRRLLQFVLVWGSRADLSQVVKRLETKIRELS